MSEEWSSPPDFQIADAAARYIGESGGRIFIWLEAFGGGFDAIRTSLDEPVGKTFVRYQAETAIDVYVDDMIIPPPDVWWLSYHRFPRRRVSADFRRETTGQNVSGGG